MIIVYLAVVIMIAIIIYSMILSNNDKYNERLWEECLNKSNSKEYKTLECISKDRKVFLEIEDMESLNRLDYDFMIDDGKREIKLFPLE